MVDELTATEWFLQVVRADGFGNAARALGKSTSAISRAVADLEASVGAPLLVRTTRRLRLTEAGAVWAAHAESLLQARRAAHEAVAELTGTPRGRLRVSMPVAVGERLLAPHLPELRRRYPELRLELDLSDQNVELLKRGFDLAIRIGRPADSSLRAQLLGKIPVLLVASPRYLETHGEPKRPADLGVHACITVGPVGGPSEWTFHRQGRRESVVVDGVTHTTSPTLAAQLAVSGLGLLRTTEWIIRDELARGRLVPVMMAWSASPRSLGGVPVYAMYGTTTAPPLKTRVFVDLVRAIMADEVLRARRT